MGKEMKNIIVLKNVYPNIFDEVIFVLNKDTKKLEQKNSNLVYEAKKIVDDYVNNKLHCNGTRESSSNNPINNKNNTLNTYLNIALFLSASLFILVLTKIF